MRSGPSAATLGEVPVDQSRFTLAAGQVLHDRYRIETPISSGAMGAVYRAWDLQDGIPVAVKHLLDSRHSERFEVEARLLSVLSHPRVVKVLDHFYDEEGQYLVMELVEGIDLHDLLKDVGSPGLPLDRAIEYVRQGCEALQYVHDQQIVHRDVKPQNLILAEPKGVVLVDFGIARLLEDDESDSGTTGIGTPRFMAPEVFAGGVDSTRSDVFGIAATLWTLLAGVPPVYASPTRLSDLCSEVPVAIEEAVDAGLQMIPERRVASVAAFARAIGGTLHETTGRSLVRSVEKPVARRQLMEAIVRTAAGVFEAAAASIALTDATTDELVYQSAWGAGASEIVGVRLPPGQGLAGAVMASGLPLAVADCRNDPRFAARIAAGTGYIPYTMLVVPLLRGGHAVGTLSLLDRRDGRRYGPDDAERAGMFAELTVAAIEADADALPRLGSGATRIRDRH
jgi:hypothetical protein